MSLLRCRECVNFLIELNVRHAIRLARGKFVDSTDSVVRCANTEFRLVVRNQKQHIDIPAKSIWELHSFTPFQISSVNKIALIFVTQI